MVWHLWVRELACQSPLSLSLYDGLAQMGVVCMRNGDYVLIVAPKDYPGKLYRGKYCYEHHYVYWKHFNILINDNTIIHHKDENKQNNNICNLELRDRIKHIKHHNFMKKSRLVMLKCPNCEKIFIKERRNTFIVKGGSFSACSRECVGLFRGLDDIVKQERINKNIINEFYDYKHKYCL